MAEHVPDTRHRPKSRSAALPADHKVGAQHPGFNKKRTKGAVLDVTPTKPEKINPAPKRSRKKSS